MSESTTITDHSLEYTVRRLLEDIGISESLNLQDINSRFENVRLSSDTIMIVGKAEFQNNLGYIALFDKNTLILKKMSVFKKMEAYDISNEGGYVLVNVVEYSTKGSATRNYISIYDKHNDSMEKITMSLWPEPLRYLSFSPLGNYIVVEASSDGDFVSIYDINTKTEVVLAVGQGAQGEVTYVFSPNEEYLFIASYRDFGSESRVSLKKVPSFAEVNLFEDTFFKKEDWRHRPTSSANIGRLDVALSDQYLIIINEPLPQIYNLKSGNIIA